MGTAMTSARSSEELFDLLVTASRDAFSKAYFESAYHSLAAALHCADSMHDEARILEVEALAEQQLGHLNSVAPGHRIATDAAAERGHPGVYAVLLTHARSMVLRNQARQTLTRIHETGS